MAKEICISSTPHETRLAILEDDQLAEIYYERENEYTLAGSIYNGRVTRVLPGMQSAFVDVGLERDAFLYVTDFLELEDQEETDELEKAAVAGGSQPPREVRHSNIPDQNGQNARGGGARHEDRPPRSGPKPDQRPDQKQESHPDRPAPERTAKERRPAGKSAPEPITASQTVPEPQLPAEPPEYAQDEAGPGAKRWRGRRRRRGSRGSVGSPEGQAQTDGSDGAQETYSETPAETGEAPVIHAAAGVPGDRSSSQGWSAGVPGDKGPHEAISASWGGSERSSSQGRGAAQIPAAAPRSHHIPVPFVLPGESLSKYGGVPADDAHKSTQDSIPVPPAGPVSTFRPATLIEAPLEWDGSGLLPGESISKHRARQFQPPVEAESADAIQAGGQPRIQSEGAAPDEIEEAEFVSEQAQSSPDSAPVQAREPAPEGMVPQTAEVSLAEEDEDDQFEETSESAPHAPGAAEPALGLPKTGAKLAEGGLTLETGESARPDPVEVHPEPGAPGLVFATGEPTRPDPSVVREHPAQAEARTPTAEALTQSADAAEPDPDASASHRVDPLPPTGFRLFGLGGKKKAEKPVSPAPAKSASVPKLSAYAPGSGLVEEEVIEEEEFDAPRHHHHAKGEEHDLDDFEEETLPTQIRSGDLGELLQEAHLDHRIQLKFDGKNGDEEDAFDEEEDEEEPSTEAQPAAGAGSDSALPRRDRGGRGRGGRGGLASSSARGDRRGPTRRSAQTSDLPIISDLLKPGQEILVQIAKEPIAKKGARITSHIALPGRFLVFMPTVSHVGVSRKIDDDAERQRLKRILTHERGEAQGGFIVRTAAEGASEEELRADLRFLLNLWAEIKQRSDSSKSPALIYHDLSLIERILRDQVSSNFSSIWVDTEADYERIVRFLNRFSPTLVRRVKLYTKEIPLFEHFGIQDEISKALRSKVWLKSGGSIVINQTEALVAIDINTGKYVGKSARLEDTILKTNLDAVPEIVRQIRLRDLGGIIVIDFIDMDERKNRFKVMAALEEALKSDRAPTKVLQFNDFGLVAITRKRVKQSLERTLSVPCPTCQATGMVKSPATVCNEIYIELRKMRKHFEGADVLLRVNPETVKVLKSNNAVWLTDFEELVGKNILVKSDATLHPEQFDIQG